MEDKTMFGLLGTALSGIGAGLSVTDVQAIVSIVITVLGFVISVLLPLLTKLIRKIKAAKADGVITKEELDDIASAGKEIVDKTGSFIKEASEKSEGEDEQC